MKRSGASPAPATRMSSTNSTRISGCIESLPSIQKKHGSVLRVLLQSVLGHTGTTVLNQRTGLDARP
jgi:hypothetical protein